MEENNQATVQPDATQAQPAVQPQPTQQVQVEQLPDDTKQKSREQFDKLLENNRKLYEEREYYRQQLEKRQQSQQTFAPIQQQTQQQAPKVNVADYIETDANGERFVNEEKLNAKIKQLEEAATKTRETTENYIKTAEQREIDRQNREALSSYPELNPMEKGYDKTFSREVRAALVDSMYNPDEYGGRALTFKEAADFIRGYRPKNQPQTDQKKEEEKKDGQNLKQQVAATVTGQPQQVVQSVQDSQELQTLRLKTQRGDDWALAERLKHTPHIVPKE